MGYLQEISACKRSADTSKLLEEFLLKAIESNNKEILLFCKETMYKKYREYIIDSEEFGEENPFIVSTFEGLL